MINWGLGSFERLVEAEPEPLVPQLQPNFALNQPLSPFALAAIELLDRTTAPTHQDLPPWAPRTADRGRLRRM